MKKTALLNPDLSYIIASLGHLDMLVVADAGLPIPTGPERIDLALTRNLPGFLETLRVILDEMKVEKVILAQETIQISPHIQQAITEFLPGITMEAVPHSRFKEMTANARAVVRTGEFTPYANVILVSGVVF
ncbi:MAG: D-ribose pyranase [Anaerolineaceae bacterium]|nr:D-ribose pyranase [Anaerolineaceae bacterium]